MKPVRKSLLVITSICLVTVSITYALLSKVTETATNTFSSDRKISLALREDKWDGYDFNEEYPSNIVPGTMADPTQENSDRLGINIAKNYYPGDVIPKNPMVKNTSNEDEYVAIKVVYEDGKGNELTKEEFENRFGKIQSINGNSVLDGYNSNFTEIKTDKKYDLYIYNDELNNERKFTDSLFDQFVIKSDIALEQGAWPTFNIKVTAFGIQSKNVELNLEDQNCQAMTALKKLAEKN